MVWEISRADYVKNSYFTICSSKTVPWIKKFQKYDPYKSGIPKVK